MGSVSPVHQSIVLEEKGGEIMVRELDSGPDGLWPLSPMANCCWCLETGTSLVCVWGASQTHGCGLCRWSTVFVMSEFMCFLQEGSPPAPALPFHPHLHREPNSCPAQLCYGWQISASIRFVWKNTHTIFSRFKFKCVSSRCINAVITDWVNDEIFMNKSPFKSWLLCCVEGVYSRPVPLKSSKHDLLQ